MQIMVSLRSNLRCTGQASPSGVLLPIMNYTGREAPPRLRVSKRVGISQVEVRDR